MLAMLIAMAALGLIGTGVSAIENWRNNKFIEEQNLLNKQWEDERNQLQIDEAQNAREWQEQMRGTEIQARMADAEAAGVNPIYAISGSSSTPSVSVPTLSTPTAQAKQLDLSGITNMLQSLTNIIMVNQMMNTGKRGDLLSAKISELNSRSDVNSAKNLYYGTKASRNAKLNSHLSWGKYGRYSS